MNYAPPKHFMREDAAGEEQEKRHTCRAAEVFGDGGAAGSSGGIAF